MYQAINTCIHFVFSFGHTFLQQLQLRDHLNVLPFASLVKNDTDKYYIVCFL